MHFSPHAMGPDPVGPPSDPTLETAVPLAMRRHFRALRIVILCMLSPSLSTPARATDIALGMGSLPSAQSWVFTTGGSPLATEAGTVSLAAGVLTINTMAFGITGVGTSAFYARPGVVNATEPIVIQMRGRLVQHEGDFTNTFVGGGFAFGFAQGTTYWQMGITPTQIRNVNGVLLSSAYDNTQFHDYRLEWNPPSTVRYYVDGTLISSSPGGAAQAINRLTLGDVTGAANAQMEIVSYRFLQGAATPVAGTTWGRVKALYR